MSSRLPLPVDDARRVLRRLLSLEVVDRSLAVGAQAFSAMIPLLIVLAGVGARGGRSFADSVIERFGLTGAGADAVRQTFSSPVSDVGLSVTGAVVVIYSALSFTRAMQRIFELSWDLPRRGLRSTGWGLAWLATFAAYWSILPVIRAQVPGLAGVLLVLAESFGLWLATPYLLLARRVAWRRLTVQAALTAAGMTALTAGAAIYVPTAMSTSAERYGGIGVAFTLLSVLWAAGFVLVLSAIVGATVMSPQSAAPAPSQDAGALR